MFLGPIIMLVVVPALQTLFLGDGAGPQGSPQDDEQQTLVEV